MALTTLFWLSSRDSDSMRAKICRFKMFQDQWRILLYFQVWGYVWDITFGWRFSQERHFDDATAQASHFFQQAFVVCVWISNTSLVEHAGDTVQCATMNLCVQEYLERYFSLCAVEAFPYQFGIWKADCPCKRLQQIQATVLLLERV